MAEKIPVEIDSMLTHFRSYYWKEGKPKGEGPISSMQDFRGLNYRIVTDPYYKRISLEQYEGQRFNKCIYDSCLFDFRMLKPLHQVAWTKEPTEEGSSIYYIKDQDDRIILREEYVFENHLCRSCQVFSSHGIFLSQQKMYYESLRDPINAVALFDSNHTIIMFKIYSANADTGEFEDVIQEEWDASKPLPLQLASTFQKRC